MIGGRWTHVYNSLIKEAILRALYPRTPTMRLCGDPVLNQQALFVQTHGERL